MSWEDILKAKELTPKQKKLDKNHNGVIDAQDFHIMNKSPDRIHYTKDGKVWRGKTHKTDDTLMTGKEHTDDSVNLLHFEDLPESIQLKIKSKGSKRNSAFTS